MEVKADIYKANPKTLERAAQHNGVFATSNPMFQTSVQQQSEIIVADEPKIKKTKSFPTLILQCSLIIVIQPKQRKSGRKS